jgi:hypothetical protein
MAAKAICPPWQILSLSNNIPVVDMQNYKTFYNEEKSINGTKNAWEYYFEQPMSYTLEHTNKAQNVILAAMEYLYDRVGVFVETEEQITKFYEVVSKHMQFNAITLGFIDKSKSQLFADKKNILGVLYRGTDYIGLKPQGHDVMAPIDDYIAKIHECLKKWNMNWIYLMTEDMKAMKIFEKEFSNKLITTDSKRIDNYNPQMGFTPSISFDCKYDNYYKGLEYIRDTVLLSYCDALIVQRGQYTVFWFLF